VKEVTALRRLLGAPEKPFAAVLGGAKIEDKIDTLENLLPRLDLLLVGGGMANTFLVAQGFDLNEVRRELASSRITLFPAVPSIYEMLANLPGERESDTAFARCRRAINRNDAVAIRHRSWKARAN
jgi:phosphoglycerate kinase